MPLKKTLSSLSFVLALVLVPFITTYGQMRQIHFEINSIATIEKISFYSASQGYIASSDNGGWIGFTSDSGRNITKRFITISNVNYNGYSVNFPFIIRGVKAFNQDTIIVYGGYNVTPSILYSTDGGLTYLLVYHSPFGPIQISHIYDMLFPQNNSIGYAVDGYRILRTTNKGLTWSVVNTDQNSPFGGLDVIDNTNVFAFSTFLSGTGGKLVKTSNAGVTWQNIPVPSPDILSADFFSVNNGWLSVMDNNHNPLIYYTGNGGASWTLQNNAQATPFQFLKMSFTNDSTGFGIGNYYQTYKTTDTGKIWEPIPIDNSFVNELNSHSDLFILNNIQLWAGGFSNLLEINTNLSAAPLPKAYFVIDTTNVYSTNNVSLKNFSKPNYQYKWYVNNNLISTNYNALYTHNISSQLDSVMLIATSGGISDTLKKYQFFIVPNLPSISSFSPTSGSVGTEITIKGTHFAGVNGVRFGGIAAQSFSVLSDTLIRAIVAGGATGTVSVSVPGGTYSLPLFTFFQPPAFPSPFINLLSPESGPVGTTVIISGNNFATNPADNIVYFGATQAIVSSSSNTQLNCTVPVGASYEPVSILNKATGLTGNSLKPFNVTFADSSYFTANSFVTSYVYNTNNNNIDPSLVSGKDIDGDGKPDMVCTFYSADSISVFRNTCNGSVVSFDTKKVIGKGGLGLKITDLDGDGKPEIISTSTINNPSTNSVIDIYKNKSIPGQIIFDPKLSKEPNSLLNDFTITDFDNDGRADIAGASEFRDTCVIIFRNTSVPGNLSFSAGNRFTTGGTNYNIAAGDIDGDGKKDMVTYSYFSTSGEYISCFRNTSSPGAISFAPRTTIPVIPGFATFLNHISLTDFDGDNKLDIVLINGPLRLLFRNLSSPGNINFSLVNLDLTGAPTSPNISNLSGDKKPDLFFGFAGSRNFSVKRNISSIGAIAMDPQVIINPAIENEAFLNHLNSADFDMDGKIDIVTSSSESGQKKFIIYKNRMGEPVTFSVCPGGGKVLSADIPGTTYQWQQDSGSGFVNISDNSFFSGTQTAVIIINNIPFAWNGYKYRCLVSGLFSSVFILQVNPALTPTITISTPATAICSGALVTFTATITNGGLSSLLQWMVNGIVVGANSSTYSTNSLQNNDRVTCKLVSSALCITTNNVISSAITMSVTGSVPSVTITASGSAACAGTPSTFSATPVNAGTNISYQWQVNGINVGTNSPAFSSSSLTAGSQVSVLMTFTSSCSSAITVMSNIISVNPVVTPSVSISSPNTTVCSGNTASFSAIPLNGGTIPSFQWQVNGVNAGTNSPAFNSSSLINGSQVKVLMTSTAACPSTPVTTSNIITMTITPRVTPAVTISGNTTVISGQSTTITGILANPGNGPLLTYTDSTSTHNWQAFGGGSALSVNYTPNKTGDKMQWQLQSNATCLTTVLATSNTLTFTVSPVTAINPVPGVDYGIRYFPNPVSKTLYIDSLKLSDKWQTLEIKSMDGKSVIPVISIVNSTATIVNVERLLRGQYIVVLRRKSGIPAYLKFTRQ